MMFRLGSVFYVLLIVALTAYGGFQIHLMMAAEERATARETNLARQPEPLEKVLAEPPENWPYRRVRMRGILAPFQPAYLYVKPTEDGGRAGAKVFMPIEARTQPFEYDEDAATPREIPRAIMSDIGQIEWPLPRERIGTFGEARDIPEPPRITNYVGTLIPAEPAGMLTPSPKRDLRLWYTRDVQAMIQQSFVEYTPDIVFFVESPQSQGHRLMPLELPVAPPHEMIAIIAFAISAVLALLFVLFGGGRSKAPDLDRRRHINARD